MIESIQYLVFWETAKWWVNAFESHYPQNKPGRRTDDIPVAHISDSSKSDQYKQQGNSA
jgi:hypothetical protein